LSRSPPLLLPPVVVSQPATPITAAAACRRASVGRPLLLLAGGRATPALPVPPIPERPAGVARFGGRVGRGRGRLLGAGGRESRGDFGARGVCGAPADVLPLLPSTASFLFAAANLRGRHPPRRGRPCGCPPRRCHSHHGLPPSYPELPFHFVTVPPIVAAAAARGRIPARSLVRRRSSWRPPLLLIASGLFPPAPPAPPIAERPAGVARFGGRVGWGTETRHGVGSRARRGDVGARGVCVAPADTLPLPPPTAYSLFAAAASDGRDPPPRGRRCGRSP